jgi:hypothetical protein
MGDFDDVADEIFISGLVPIAIPAGVDTFTARRLALVALDLLYSFAMLASFLFSKSYGFRLVIDLQIKHPVFTFASP